MERLEQLEQLERLEHQHQHQRRERLERLERLEHLEHLERLHQTISRRWISGGISSLRGYTPYIPYGWQRVQPSTVALPVGDCYGAAPFVV